MLRSQAILRMPVNSVLAKLTLHDGERSDVLLFIPAGEDITHVVSPGTPFVPMISNARFWLIARRAIAALAVVTGPELPDDDALPITRQRVRVRLFSGTTLEGELRWTRTDDCKRTSDHINESAAFFVLHAPETKTIHYVAKSQVAGVEEI